MGSFNVSMQPRSCFGHRLRSSVLISDGTNLNLGGKTQKPVFLLETTEFLQLPQLGL